MAGLPTPAPFNSPDCPVTPTRPGSPKPGVGRGIGSRRERQPLISSRPRIARPRLSNDKSGITERTQASPVHTTPSEPLDRHQGLGLAPRRRKTRREAGQDLGTNTNIRPHTRMIKASRGVLSRSLLGRFLASPMRTNSACSTRICAGSAAMSSSPEKGGRRRACVGDFCVCGISLNLSPLAFFVFVFVSLGFRE